MSCSKKNKEAIVSGEGQEQRGDGRWGHRENRWWCLVTKWCLTFVTPWTAAHQASLSLTISWGLPKRISDAIQPSHPPSRCCSTFNLSRQQKVFSSESAVPIRWPKYWSFSFSISPSSECSGLISFRIDWFDLLAVQGTLKSLFQHHSSKASILRRSKSSFCWLYTTFLSSDLIPWIYLLLPLYSHKGFDLGHTWMV